MTCTTPSQLLGCYLNADGVRQTVVVHNVSDSSSAVVATLYLDVDHKEVPGATADNVTLGSCTIDWSEAQGYICDQDDERFGQLVCWDYGYDAQGNRIYPVGSVQPTYLDQKTGEALVPQPALVGKANPAAVSESTYKCYTGVETVLQTTASDESGTLVWDDAAQGTDFSNAYNFTVTDVGGLAGLNMGFSLDEADGLGSVFALGGSNGSTNGDNGGAYQFRAGFEGQTDQDSRLRHIMDFSEPVIIDSFFVGDIDRGGDQTQIDITRWQDAARVYGIDSAGNIVEFEQIPGSDLVVHDNGFTYMPQDAVEQAGDEDAGNWLTVNSQGNAVVKMVVEYFPGTDAGWNSNESADPNYAIPNSSSRMQLHNLLVTRATLEEVEVTSKRQACATLDADSSEVWRDAITLARLTDEQLATLAECDSAAAGTTPQVREIGGCVTVDGEKVPMVTQYTLDESGVPTILSTLPLSDYGLEDCC